MTKVKEETEDYKILRETFLTIVEKFGFDKTKCKLSLMPSFGYDLILDQFTNTSSSDVYEVGEYEFGCQFYNSSMGKFSTPLDNKSDWFDLLKTGVKEISDKYDLLIFYPYEKELYNKEDYYNFDNNMCLIESGVKFKFRLKGLNKQ